jgi:hypothetical protein
MSAETAASRRRHGQRTGRASRADGVVRLLADVVTSWNVEVTPKSAETISRGASRPIGCDVRSFATISRQFANLKIRVRQKPHLLAVL